MPGFILCRVIDRSLEAVVGGRGGLLIASSISRHLGTFEVWHFCRGLLLRLDWVGGRASRSNWVSEEGGGVIAFEETVLFLTIL